MKQRKDQVQKMIARQRCADRHQKIRSGPFLRSTPEHSKYNRERQQAKQQPHRKPKRIRRLILVPEHRRQKQPRNQDIAQAGCRLLGRRKTERKGRKSVDCASQHRRRPVVDPAFAQKIRSPRCGNRIDHKQELMRAKLPKIRPVQVNRQGDIKPQRRSVQLWPAPQ